MTGIQRWRMPRCTAMIMGASLTGSLVPVNAQESAFQDEMNRIIRDFVAQNTAITVVLADSSLISLGIMDFDPNQFADFGDLDVGNQESFDLRQSLRAYTLPWSFKPVKVSERWSRRYQLRFSYVGSEQDIIYDNPDYVNTFDEESLVFYAEQAWQYQFNKHWRVDLGLGAQFIHYENDFAYQDPTLILLRDFFDDQLLNTSYNAWLLDPLVSAMYQGEAFGHRFDYKVQYRYAVGHTFHTESANQRTRINTGRLTNTFTFHYETPDIFENNSQIRLLARRIDVDHDAVAPIGASHYYEYGVGLLVDTSSHSSWLDNIGIGISLNVGSNLSGGTVVLLFNEEM